ncbi:hypothetical protein [Candidatus Uabimicrobium sp. HlEnr_7]|uniref:hypothetical protein n=1 Tax=Candidatus Uabimicrobium helgolandensis TaxID=3095367 RepID=UPI0035563820
MTKIILIVLFFCYSLVAQIDIKIGVRNPNKLETLPKYIPRETQSWHMVRSKGNAMNFNHEKLDVSSITRIYKRNI